VESVTGLSRRALIAVGLAVVLGVVASTVATFVSARGRPGCGDVEFGCATFLRSEPVVLGVLSPREDVRRAVRLVADLWGRVRSRPVRVLAWNDRCTPAGGAAGARELATDAPDEPPVVAVVAETCGGAITPAAQILGDSGVTLLSMSGTPVPPGAGRPAFYLAPGPVPPVPLQTFGAAFAQRHGPPQAAATAAAYTADAVLRTAARLARPGPDGSLLVPRTGLRDRLLGSGFVQVG
jgi:hypothetical protein